MNRSEWMVPAPRVPDLVCGNVKLHPRVSLGKQLVALLEGLTKSSVMIGEMVTGPELIEVWALEETRNTTVKVYTQLGDAPVLRPATPEEKAYALSTLLRVILVETFGEYDVVIQ